MKILLIGSGGREHALATFLSHSRHQPTLFFAPGNPGMATLGQRLEIDATDIEGLCLFAKREQIDLTVVGPEAPLSLGLADRFHQEGLLVFGPTQAGAQVEASKHLAKQWMQEANIPTASFAYCTSHAQAISALDTFQPPYVIKEDGLAAGKGVTVTASLVDARAAIDKAFEKNMPVVLESFLQGQEVSILAVCDGKNAIPLISAQDFKRLGAGNTGPNTGGMGAYAPVPFVNESLLQTVQQRILQPMMAVMQQHHIDYRGILYAGLMVDDTGCPSVVEFNCRFGDPETQVVLPLLKDDLADILYAAASGDLSAYLKNGFSFHSGASVTVVLAAKGYPEAPETGHSITLPTLENQDNKDKHWLFHAGTGVLPDHTLITKGGRVLNATAWGGSIESARENAYTLVKQVHFEGCYYRPDIAAIHTAVSSV